MDGRRFFGNERIIDQRQFLVFCLDKDLGFAGDLVAIGGDNCQGLADISHPLVAQDRLIGDDKAIPVLPGNIRGRQNAGDPLDTARVAYVN
jgi:hypothetical protein